MRAQMTVCYADAVRDLSEINVVHYTISIRRAAVLASFALAWSLRTRCQFGTALQAGPEACCLRCRSTRMKRAILLLHVHAADRPAINAGRRNANKKKRPSKRASCAFIA